ncbi:MAG: hypothetical protein A6F71_00290 [Cycloclasticus sp. symbiont of Poecilosclerida sp. M]|nr:MAG: hypothetical protein A6F71_00290 [Cycloclasticus sp. symbiont of Poecilosclerida sp. M]
MNLNQPMLACFDKSQVRRSFDLASGKYNHFASLQRGIGEKLLARYQDVKSLPERVLDIGSGTGFLTMKLQEAYPSSTVSALDLSLGMLQQSRSLSADSAANYVCSDAEGLPIRSIVLDYVFSNLAYQWCPNLQDAFSESYRVLKNKGAFVFSTFGPNTLNELRDAWGEVDDGVHVNSFVSLKDIRRQLKAVGFVDISLHAENIVLHYDSAKAVMKDIKGMGAHNINHTRRKGLTGVGRFKKLQLAYECKRCEQGLPATYQAIYAVCHKPFKK